VARSDENRGRCACCGMASMTFQMGCDGWYENGWHTASSQTTSIALHLSPLDFNPSFLNDRLLTYLQHILNASCGPSRSSRHRKYCPDFWLPKSRGCISEESTGRQQAATLSSDPGCGACDALSNFNRGKAAHDVFSYFHISISKPRYGFPSCSSEQA
jgi:hypothetical protein